MKKNRVSIPKGSIKIPSHDDYDEPLLLFQFQKVQLKFGAGW